MIRRSIHVGFMGCFLAGIAAIQPAFAQGLWSVLYPKDWTPAFTGAEGRFLHDFSYAGYHNGVASLPVSAGPLFNAVTGYGADPTGAADATAPIQAAIDAAQAAGGGLVFLPAGFYRCDGTLTVTGSNMTLRGEGPEATRVYFTSYDGMSNKAHLTFRGNVLRGADILLAADGENRSSVVKVSDASELHPGDEVALGWVITDEFIAEHGMTGTWVSFNGQWKPFFRREVVAVNLAVSPPEITLDVPLRYAAKMRDGASLRKESGYLSECVVEKLGLSNGVDYAAAWNQDQAHVVEFNGVKDSVMRELGSFAAPHPEARECHLQSSGLEIGNAKRVTVADCRMEKAQNRGSGGNGYLFEVRQSSEILFRDCVARDGRHNFIQNWDFGATGIVWLRCESTGSTAVTRLGDGEIGVRAYSEFHHSLAMANLVDSCTFDDGWASGNREDESSGAGHCATQCVCWNTTGVGSARIRSFNYENGYVIGAENIEVLVNQDILFGHLDRGAEPPDFTEYIGEGNHLLPASLYEDQLQRRTAAGGLPASITEYFSAGSGDDVCFEVIYPGTAETGDFTWVFTPKEGGPAQAIPEEDGPRLCLQTVRKRDAGTYVAVYDNEAKASATYTAVLEVENTVPAINTAGILLAIALLGIAGTRLIRRPNA